MRSPLVRQLSVKELKETAFEMLSYPEGQGWFKYEGNSKYWEMRLMLSECRRCPGWFLEVSAVIA